MGKNSKSNVSILNNLIHIHQDLVNFGVMVQTESTDKFNKEHHIEAAVYDSFSLLNSYAIRTHKAILCLCNEGWTDITPILLRAIMECSINLLAIANYELPEYMAFKYLSHDLLKLIRDNYYSEKLREEGRRDLRKGLNNIENPAVHQRAEESIKREKLYTYWFQPEFKRVSEIIKKFGRQELKSELQNAYNTLSTSIHAASLGTVIFKDIPEKVNIEPCENPRRTRDAILASCKLLLDLFVIRNDYEDLKCDLVYQGIYDDLVIIKNE